MLTWIVRVHMPQAEKTNPYKLMPEIRAQEMVFLHVPQDLNPSQTRKAGGEGLKAEKDMQTFCLH